jgi:adenosine/AMP kinase
MEERKYLTTWKRYIPVIRLHLKRSLNEEQQFKLNITDFESAGDRGKSGYTFNIALENGKVINLYEALKNDEAIKAMLVSRSIKISVGKSFVLSIKNNHISAFK